MFGLETLDVAIGLIFVFLLVSILVSAVREGIEAVLKTRAAFLWLGIRELLHDKSVEGLADAFYRHPMIFSLFPDKFDPIKPLDKPHVFANGRGAPSYIPSRNFAVALMDIAARGPVTGMISSDAAAPAISLENIRANVANLRNPAVQRVVLAAVDSAQCDLNRAQANIEAWFNSSMDRVSGWYKRTTQWWLFAIGLLVAVGMNVNTLTIGKELYRNPTLRAALVKQADAYLQETSAQDPDAAKDAGAKYEQTMKQLQSLNIPIGYEGMRLMTSADWREPRAFWKYVAVPILGWFMTAFAAAMGAPFWFDLLNKVMVIRSTVKPHEKSLEEGSEDRQPKPKAGTNAPPETQPPAPPLAPPPDPSQTALAQRIASDIESRIDACDVDMMDETPDEDLPQAQGGVQ